MKRSSFALLCALLLSLPAHAQEGAQQIVHLLDYVGVDYAGAVEDGKVKSADEYREMTEFAAQAQERMRALPENPARSSLAGGAAALVKLIEDKAPAPAVAEAAAKLRWALVNAYDVRVAPRRAPDLARGKFLYAANCAACHGAEGRGDGPAGKGLDPAPANFHDAARMSERSLYGLYNAITLGVTGTSMAPFAQLGEEDRWALAFFVGGLGMPAERLAKGAAAWRSGAAAAAFPDLASLTGYSANEVRHRDGEAAALAQDYLRAHPEALQAGKPGPIPFARGKLAQSLAALRAGDRAAARDAAVASYLEGFELVENSLDNVDKALRLDIEREMLALRAAIAAGEPAAAFEARVARIDALLAAAEGKLDAGELSPGAAFASSLLILLREGLEAILVLAAIIAFVTRTGRRDALPYVHAGWAIALLAGLATWFAASSLIDISGSNREITEGVTALIAAAMLLYVGYWLHGRSQAQAWNRFIRESVGSALGKDTLWAMAGVSFLAVYRELFELVLFYEALWVQAGADGHVAVLGGMAAAILLLAAAGWGIFKYSVRLPLGPFFALMSLLLALLAIAFTGQGVAALQEAGVVGASPIAFVSVPMLGVHPTLETLGAQALAAALVALGAWAARRMPSARVQPKS
ncbi:MAG TPA: cytochrome c/FTR1 family iron permease [Burkholderiales bacterium]|nr:cytochrome c/FTR1 family iron permease [Burkholderiales bacterium]